MTNSTETPSRPKPRNKGGRKRGVPNRVRADLMALAQVYTKDSLTLIAQVLHGTASYRKNIPELDKDGKPTGRVKRIRVTHDISAGDRLKAAEMLLDRAHGKPRQAMEHTIKPLDLTALNDDDFNAIGRIIRRASEPGAVGDGASAPAGAAGAGDHGTKH